MFAQTGITVFTAIFQLFLIAFAAGLLVRKNIISQLQIQSLANVTVNIFLPCLIIAKTLINFRPQEFANWWYLPLSGALIMLVGLLYSAVVFRFKAEKRPMMALASIQNAVYIVLPIGHLLFPDQFGQFAMHCFLMLIGLNPIMWSVGKVMISAEKDAQIRWSDFITPPLAAVFISVAAVFTGLSNYIPDTIVASMDMLGQGTVPLAIFILGASIGSISLRHMPALTDILIVTAVKFILIPSTVFAVLLLGKFHASMPLFGIMMMLQASAPPATNLILMVKNYGGDTQAVSSMMLLQYLICIPAMPLWIAAWRYAETSF